MMMNIKATTAFIFIIINLYGGLTALLFTLCFPYCSCLDLIP